ncbi:MAG: nicotinamide-nucleotide amidohydrolase family protein [Chlamydiia bacterium]|nr:nicotinamide-nucleotide amidohydrolase family protein [Chlamydiia bacterium]
MRSIHAGILTVGDELLVGKTLNRNATYLSKTFDSLGIQTRFHESVGDTQEAILEALSRRSCSVDLLVITGGLGPTFDDRTRPALMEFYGSKPLFLERVFEELSSRYHQFPESLREQATIPSDAEPLENPVGTAPGLYFPSTSKTSAIVVALPGVPTEMEAIVTDHLINRLLEHFKGLLKPRSSLVYAFCMRKEPEIDPHIRTLSEEFSELSFGIYPTPGVLEVVIRGEDERLRQIEHAVTQKMVGWGGRPLRESLLMTLHRTFIENKFTLSAAESCTGGAFAAAITALSGASEFFLGSLVTYSNTSKSALLGVDADHLESHGAVSSIVALEMARGSVSRLKSSFSIAFTGIAGPTGATPTKPLGLVYLAIAGSDGREHVEELHLRGPRHLVVEKCVNIGLFRLLEFVAPLSS